VLLVGAGSSVERHLDAILRLVSAESVKVFALNEANPVLRNYVDFHVLSHNAKRINYNQIFKSEKVHVIAPLNRFSEHEIEEINLDKMIDLPMEVRKDSFFVDREKVVVPYDLTIAYAIAALISKGIRSMYLVGFDGYGKGDIRQKEMSDLIYLIRSNFPNVNLISLTPTTYPMVQSSIYAEHNWL
jgi:4-hydroxy 2-oxovalerate aldolase